MEECTVEEEPPVGPIEWLFSTPFMTRNHCGAWDGPLTACYVASNVVIAIAYFGIPAALWYLWYRRRREIPRPGMLWLFGLFVFLCGLTHLCDLASFWWPAWRLFTLIYALTAAVSFAAAVALPGTVRYLLSMPSTQEYLLEILRAQKAEQELREELERRARQNLRLETELSAMRDVAVQLQHRRETEQVAAEIRQRLHNIRGALQ